jgi:hypothetical protein
MTTSDLLSVLLPTVSMLGNELSVGGMPKQAPRETAAHPYANNLINFHTAPYLDLKSLTLDASL